MRIALVAALARNGVIGRDNRLPWRLPADLQHFKQLTMGRPIVMGRRTWASLGRPLPGRRNIVVTRDRAFRCDGCVVTHSIDEALAAAAGSEEVMIIGGAELYAQTLPQADRLYLTQVMADVEGDVRFPDFDTADWVEVERRACKADGKNEYDYQFVVLDRRPAAREAAAP
jgi:dihydrofolate reductase